MKRSEKFEEGEGLEKKGKEANDWKSEGREEGYREKGEGGEGKVHSGFCCDG